MTGAASRMAATGLFMMATGAVASTSSSMAQPIAVPDAANGIMVSASQPAKMEKLEQLRG